MTQLKIPAVYMRGGTSKGVFFHADALPSDPRRRDAILLRVIGSPDPYGKQIDGMGGASSSTSKVALVSRSTRPDCDVDYLFGAVPISGARIDWSGNCGNLTAAVGPFAISEGLVDAVPDGVAVVRIWQANIGKRIVAHVPMQGGAVVEDGDFELDGVTFPAAEIRLDFLDPGGADDGEPGGAMFPTGRPSDTLAIAGVGSFEVTYIDAGNPAIFIDAGALGLSGAELQGDVNGNAELLQLCETIRAHGAVAMGLAATPAEATALRPHTPKLAFVAPPLGYTSSAGRQVGKQEIDLNARILSMGQLHHAMTGTGAVAIAAAAAIPGTLLSRLLGGRAGAAIRFGHPSGILRVGAEATQTDGGWRIAKVTMSRSARRLMEGWVRVPRGSA
jgi:2-methylaconitate isomerase